MPDDPDNLLLSAASLKTAREAAANSGKRLVEALQDVTGLEGPRIYEVDRALVWLRRCFDG